MQIKKGPYGYYAIEKFDSPDKLCTYAEEVIAGNKTDFYLPPITENFGTGIMCCYEFSGYLQLTDPEFSVFSPVKKTTTRKTESKNLSLRRKACGDLFYSFAKLLDNLISPSCIVLDPNLIFTDPEGITLKVCCLPLKSSPDDLCIAALGASRLEELLNCDFFKGAVTEDERNALVYSVKDNNESMFIKLAGIIRGTDESFKTESKIEVQDESSTKSVFTSLSKKISKTKMDLAISAISSVLSLLSLKSSFYFPCILLFALALLVLLTTVLDNKRKLKNIGKTENNDLSIQRSSILFSDNALATASENNGKNYTGLTSGKLSLISDTSGINPDYSLYLDETRIGSDCFVADIVLDEPQIAPLHAVIRQNNGVFCLIPSKGSGKTYIEDSLVENGKSYEIKIGQKLTFGDISFRFTT